ncbi:MAG: hypothetical protein ACI9LE_002132 [Paraglaciecola sp.]|jgi:hypothetical protein
MGIQDYQSCISFIIALLIELKLLRCVYLLSIHKAIGVAARWQQGGKEAQTHELRCIK